jgi:hypothetical protein
MSTVIYPNGNATVTVPAAQSIAVYSAGTAKVYRSLGYPNYPAQLDLIGTVNGGETIFGAYASGATIVIEAGPAGAEYETGASPHTDGALVLRSPITTTQMSLVQTVTVPTLTTTDLPTLSTTQIGQLNTCLISANTVAAIIDAAGSNV